MVRHADQVGPDTRERPAPHRGLVLASATVGFGVIQLDVSVVNVAVKPIGGGARPGWIAGAHQAA
jgi:hypothetical protein